MKKLFITFFSIVFFLGLTGFIYFYVTSLGGGSISDQEKKQVIEQGSEGRPLQNIPSGPQSSGRYDGKTLTFAYPTTAREYTYNSHNEQQQAGLVELFRFQEFSPSYFFTVSVTDGATTLSDVSGVTFRRQQHDIYTEESGRIGGADAAVFSKDVGGEAERTSFVISHGRLYTFSVTGSDQERIKEVFQMVTSSVMFK